MFIPFDRLDAEARGIEGTGIGLSLSKTFVEAMGGTIGLETAVGRGSTFWVDLPEAPGGDIANGVRLVTLEMLSGPLTQNWGGSDSINADPPARSGTRFRSRP